jgi:N-acyl-D-amino-acid deacylase
MSRQTILLLGLLFAMAGCQQAPTPFLSQYQQIDLLIESGTVLDGLGNEALTADIAVVGERIVFVGDADFSPADLASRVVKRIDASGKTVSPGFIDLHSHGDPLETPAMESFLAMGVTTISLGQDGSSPDVAPLSDWLAEVSANGIGTNLVMFIGHGTLRNQAGIGRSGTPEPEAMQRMLEALRRSLAYTYGLSTGLEYNPGLNASTEELRALARVVGESDRMIMSHLRNEDDDQLENSIAELLEQGEYARVHISHLKSVFGQGSARALEILDILAAARADGIDVSADVYPYTASYTGIDIVFPVWAKTSDQFELARTRRRAELAEYLQNRVNRRNGPEAMLLGTDPYTGKTLADLAHEIELTFEDVLIDVIGPDGGYAAYFVMNDELQSHLLADPLVGVCSDGSPSGFHPRGHGTFARIIEKYVLEDRVLTLSEAIRKLTSFPAQLLRIDDRGIIGENMIADLLVFDPRNVHENATYTDPLQLAEGFDVVIVNGKIARENGRQAEDLFGRVLQPHANQ